MKQNLINMQAEGALKIVGKDLSVTQARMIEREMQLLGYKATTERMSAEAAKKQAENTAEKIIKDYERSGQKLNIDEKNSLREWIFGGISQLSEIIESVSKFKQAQSLLKRLEKVIRKPKNNVLLHKKSIKQAVST